MNHTLTFNNHPNLRILHIASGDLWAGAEVQLFTLAKTLHNQSGVSVSVILLNQGKLADKLLVEGVEVEIFDESALNSFQILRHLINTIKRRNPDVIHTHRLKENILGSIAGLLSGGVPSIRTAHGAPEHRPSFIQLPKHIFRFLDWIAGSIIQKRIIAVSEELSHRLGIFFPAEKIRVIENGLDAKSVQSQITKQVRDSDKYNDTLIIGIAGRLVPVKRVDLFIQTARYILDHYPELKTSFHIYGDGPMRNELEDLSRELGIEEIIHFEGHCDDIPQVLQGLDVLLMTSDHEGLPMVLLEAMAVQTPIIAHAVGGIPKLLDYGTCGILVKEQNVDSYAQEILQLQLSPQRFSELSKNALARVQSTYSAERNAHEYLSIYSEITKKANQGTRTK